MARPRRVPAGGRGGIRRLSNPRRARMLRHPSPRGRREGARPRRRRPRLPRPSRNLRTHVPQGAAMARASIARDGLLRRDLCRDPPPRDSTAPRWRILRNEHLGRPLVRLVQSARWIALVRGRARLLLRRRLRAISGGIQPEPPSVPRRERRRDRPRGPRRLRAREPCREERPPRLRVHRRDVPEGTDTYLRILRRDEERDR